MSRPELTFEEFCQMPFKCVLVMTGDWWAARSYLNDQYGVQIEVRATRKHHGGWQPEERFYSLDRDGRTFTTLDQVYVAYMETVCGEKNT